MTRQISFRSDSRGKRRLPTSPSYAEWRENMRDAGDMLSGIYQDLRGDLSDSVVAMTRGMRDTWRRKKSSFKN